VAADNRLNVDQLAALSVGDTVTIESGHEFNRPRYAAGTVIPVGMSHADVCCDGYKGARYVERYRLRDGLREARVGPSWSRPTPARLPPAASRAARPDTSSSSTGSGTVAPPTSRPSACCGTPSASTGTKRWSPDR
jgi:hypothetical protein